MSLNAEVSGFIKGMERAGRLAAQTLKFAGTLVKPGISTAQIDDAVLDFILTRGAKAAPLGYHGYPRATCTSINDVICHGVPGNEILKNGDVINIDVTVLLDGFHGDTSFTFEVGEVSARAKDIADCAQKAMLAGIEQVAPGNTTGDIGFAISRLVTRRGYAVVKEIGGHGIGKIFHDEPFVPSFGKKGRGDTLKPWRCITVEPMINENDKPLVEYSIPNSTIMYYRTADGTLSAQYEHTVLITDKGHEIMTLD